MSVWSVAAAQSGSRPGEIDHNLSRHLDFIHQAAELQVDVLVFPELSLSGYELALSPTLAMEINDPRLDAFASAASEYQMSIVIGLPLLQGDQTLLGALTFLADGTKLAYGKRELFGEENLFFQAGEGVPLFGYRHHHVALAICADISVEEYARDAARRGANLYATSVLASEKGYAKDCEYLARWSKEYKMPVLMANHALPTGGYQSAGKSAFWDEQGRQVVSGSSGEQLVIARRTGKDWQGEVHSLRYPSVI
ncbi:carbon-nitrogen hydrolase family protein [Pantoea sp. BAV 3049]|uniref:carbon-nitrogen hydrolase family protein n=1 Tax=Pantoea sp. BAV 3049 TaxID=2654188 RepID=UPI00131D5AC0|nr:carbon-nitrogen hydrolase family protein [Pantoea sp. BAV 3049]